MVCALVAYYERKKLPNQTLHAQPFNFLFYQKIFEHLLVENLQDPTFLAGMEKTCSKNRHYSCYKFNFKFQLPKSILDLIFFFLMKNWSNKKQFENINYVFLFKVNKVSVEYAVFKQSTNTAQLW